MADIIKITERQNLRLRVLEDLYELYFSGGPETFSKGRQEGLVGSKNELFIDNEHHKAYHYLQGKKFIEITSVGNDMLAIHITSDGIDFFEATSLK